MKRIVLLLSLAIFCIAAICYAVPHYRRGQEARMRQTAYTQRFADSKPLVLDAVTRVILSGADRVETFRLMNPNEDYDEKDSPVSKAHTQYLDQCEVMRIGQPQNRVFAAALQAALSKVPSPLGKDGQLLLAPVRSPNDFGADVGFRVWKGKAHTDICIGLYSNFVEITTEDKHDKPLVQTIAILAESGPAFLSLSKQAFPQDAALAALK